MGTGLGGEGRERGRVSGAGRGAPAPDGPGGGVVNAAMELTVVDDDNDSGTMTPPLLGVGP